MPIEASSVYTKERILGLSKHVGKTNIGWIVLLILNIFAIFEILWFFDGTIYSEEIYLILLMVFLDLVYVFLYVVLPRISANKAPALNATVKFVFNEENYHVETQTENVTESSVCKWSMIKKVENQKTDVYLFVNSRQAYIVDVSEFSPEKLWIFKDLLYRKIPAKKIKWKD